METINRLEALKKAKQILSEELNRLKDEINRLQKEKQLIIPNTAIHKLEQEFKDVSANDIAKILAYGIIVTPTKPTIVGVKFDIEYVIIHYTEN